MASAQSSQDTWRGRGRQPQILGNAQPRHRSESRRLSDRRRPVKTLARKCDHRLGALHEGDPVRVFSRSADKWVDGEVVKFVDGNFVRVEYEIGEDWCGKTLCTLSEHFIIPAALLQHVFVQIGSQDVRPITDVLEFSYVGNSSFATEDLLTDDCVIEYCGCSDEDILLKVYRHDNKKSQNAHVQFALQDYIHAMQKERASISVQSGCFLGLVVHHDLNKDWLWKMRKENPAKFKNFFSRSSEGGYHRRDDPIGERLARDADYLISFTTGNKTINDQMLRHLSSHPVQGPHCRTRRKNGDGQEWREQCARPIRFCTDRSLGFGGHFDAPQGLHLYLGKHGFGQPTASGAWFDEYRKAASQTRHGVLVLNSSLQYIWSRACRMELAGITSTNLNIYYKSVANDKIFPWAALIEQTPEWNRMVLGQAMAAEICEGGVKVAKMLLDKQADPNVNIPVGKYSSRFGHVTNRGMTPLMLSVEKGLDEMVAALIQAKADVNWQEESGNGRRSALWSALEWTKELLLDKNDWTGQKRIGVDINSKTEGDLYKELEDSLLHTALDRLDLRLLELLLDAGAEDPGLPDTDARGMVEWYFRLGPDGRHEVKGGTVFSVGSLDLSNVFADDDLDALADWFFPSDDDEDFFLGPPEEASPGEA